MDAKKALAPTGKLRAGMNIGNNLFTRQNETGQLYGVSVDLMQELANRLGVPLQMVVYNQPGQVADDVGNDVWDVAILAIEKTRAKSILFSPAMTEIEALRSRSPPLFVKANNPLPLLITESTSAVRPAILKLDPPSPRTMTVLVSEASSLIRLLAKSKLTPLPLMQTREYLDPEI